MEKDKKLIMMTGANRGIRLEVIKTLLKSHPEYNFLMCARSTERDKAALEQLKNNSLMPNLRVLISLLIE